MSPFYFRFFNCAAALPVLSPDGSWIAYQSDESGSVQIHVRPYRASGEAIRVSPNGGTSPWWSPDGRELLYRRGQEVWSASVDVGSTFRHRAPRVILTADFLANPSGGFLASGHGFDRFVAVRLEPPHLPPRLVFVPNWQQEFEQAVGRRAGS